MILQQFCEVESSSAASADEAICMDGAGNCGVGKCGMVNEEMAVVKMSNLKIACVDRNVEMANVERQRLPAGGGGCHENAHIRRRATCVSLASIQICCMIVDTCT